MRQSLASEESAALALVGAEHQLPEEEGQSAHTAGSQVGVSRLPEEGLGKGQARGEGRYICHEHCQGRGHSSTGPPLRHNSIGTHLNLLPTGCLPRTVQGWGCSSCPSRKVQRSVQKPVCQMLGSEMEKRKDGEGIKTDWKGDLFKMRSQGILISP